MSIGQRIWVQCSDNLLKHEHLKMSSNNYITNIKFTRYTILNALTDYGKIYMLFLTLNFAWNVAISPY